MTRTLILAASMVLFGTNAYAYYSVMDTGEIMAPGQYKVTPELQFVTQDGNANFNANFDAGINEESGVRAQIGFGDTDFSLGGFFKYMPYPDTDSQPAIGFNIGLVYARDAGSDDVTVRFEPIVSKKFEVNFGSINPYVSLPLGAQHRSAAIYADDHNNLTVQLAAGTQVNINSVPNWGFMAEVGFDLNKAFNYVSFGAAWYFGNGNDSKKASSSED